MKDYTTKPELFGYYDAIGQTEPAFDPGVSPCLICGENWTDGDVRTIELVSSSGYKSYFYRVHKSCHISLSEEKRNEFEQKVVDSMEELPHVLSEHKEKNNV